MSELVDYYFSETGIFTKNKDMEAVEPKTRLTNAQLTRLEAGDAVAVTASWAEFMAFLPTSPYRTEYHNGQIIIMGLAAFIHEVLIGNLIALLKAAYSGSPFFVAGSNVGVLKSDRKGYYNPDITVVKGRPLFWAGSNAIITNPYLVVEVLSESTANYDLGHKLPKYEQIDSVNEVVFVDRFNSSVSTFRRTETPNVWTQTNYYSATDLVQIDHFTISLSAIFANLPDDEAA